MNKNQFFLVIPPSFEDLAIQEFTLKWPWMEKILALHFALPAQSLNFPSIQKERGGLTLELPLVAGFLLNVFLKIPTRILLRLDSFKCRDFPKLFNKIKKTSWHPYLKGQMPEIKSASFHSRVFDSGRISRTVQEALQGFYKAQAPKQKDLEATQRPDFPTTHLYLRFQEDLCQLSLDTSGEKLYKRSKRQKVGEAPLRENLAAGLILKLWDGRPLPPTPLPLLLDPMTGSGTFPLEARSFFELALERDFSFLHFPCFAKFVPPFKKLLEKVSLRPPLFQKFLGQDILEKILQGAESNTAHLNRHSSFPTEFRHHDLFSPEKGTDSSQISEAWVITNPPYGVRLGLEGHSPIKYFRRVLGSIQEKYRPQILGIIVPEGISPHKLVNSSLPLTLRSQMKFQNGGLRVQFLVFSPH